MSGRFTFSLQSLGCPKTLIDSETILASMVREGFLLSEDAAGSDIVIINTCCFIEDARRESCAAITEALALKSKGLVGRVVVYGCLAQREKEALLSCFSELDGVVGLGSRDEVPHICRRLLSSDQEREITVPEYTSRSEGSRTRLRITPRHFAYLKITEGCDNMCAYCVIPSIRGPLRSREIHEVVDEALELADDGATEIDLVAQDTAAFGLDRGSLSELPRLIHELSAVPGIEWIRILYAHPAHLTEPIIEAIAETDKVVKYIDVPVQHASDKILQKMGRNTSRDDLVNLISAIRRMVEGVVVRTTLIVGLPGESDEDFDQLLDFVKETRFERLGAFIYSREEGTVAYGLPEQVPGEVKNERYERLMRTQQQIAYQANRELVGKVVRSVVDGRSDRDTLPWVGRTYGDAPEIDNNIYLAGRSLKPGMIIDAEIVEAEEYDLIGRHVTF